MFAEFFNCGYIYEQEHFKNDLVDIFGVNKIFKMGKMLLYLLLKIDSINIHEIFA